MKSIFQSIFLGVLTLNPIVLPAAFAANPWKSVV